MKKIVILFALFATLLYAGGLPSWYYKIKSVQKQKEAFVKIMLPLIKRANKNTLKEREFIENFFKSLQKKGFGKVESNDLQRLAYLSKKYKIKNFFDEQAYLLKIDKVPVSLALTQAAIESAWGKSRFAKYANNLFGEWTYYGKGLVPERRGEGKTHKIRIFASLQDSVNSYVTNLNRNSAYKEFRFQRYQARMLGGFYRGTDAAKTMVKYSELRGQYVSMITKFMKRNHFLRYDDMQQNEDNKNITMQTYAYLIR